MIYLLLLLITFSFNQDSAQNIIKEVQKKYSTINDLSADLIQGVNQSKFIFKKPNKFKIDFKNTSIISDGKVVYNYSKKQAQVTVSNYEGNFLSPEYLLFNLPEKADSKLELEASGDVKLFKITFNTSTEKLEYKQMIVWVNSDYLITKLRIIENSGNTYQFSLSNININKAIKDSQFNFKAPDGVKVIDLR